MATLLSTSTFPERAFGFFWRFIAVAALSVAGCSSPDAATPDANTKFPADALMVVTSDSGKYSIELRTAPDQPPSRGTIAVEYRISDAASGGAVDGLHVAVTPWMTAMGHGSSTDVQVTPKNDGRYVLTGVSLFMPGAWELRTEISDGAVDHATPVLQIP